jgi:hypothetical protein
MMKAETFDQIVKNRANERAVNRIAAFKKEVMAACKKLVGEFHGYGGAQLDAQVWQPEFRQVLGILASDNAKKGWPAKIWDEESAAVTKELLNIMDEMQKALLSKDPSEEDDQPKTEESAV